MAKRQASGQINQDRPSGSDDEDYEDNVHAVASADVLAKRQIAKPRARRAAAPTQSAQPQSSAFASLGAASNPFGNLSKPSAVVPAAAPAKQSTDIQLLAINKNFHNKINEAFANSSSSNWTAICEKYIEYARSIESGTNGLTGNAPAPKPIAANNAPPITQSSTQDSKPAFSFGSTGATSESAEKTSKPVFSFDKPANTESTETTSAEPKKSVFSFGKPAETSTNASNDSKPSGFTFSAASSNSTTDAKPVFSFGPPSKETPKESTDSKPVFSFGKPTGTKSEPAKDSTNESAPSKSAFSFGKPAESDASESKTDKPIFSFGKPAESTTSDPKPADKPVFSFGKPAEPTTSDSKPAEKPAFSFGKPAEPNTSDAKPAEKPIFSFGQPQTNKPEESKPDSKPVFSFGKPAEPASDNAGAPKPSFSFGKPAEPASSNADAPKPAFSFGSSTSNEKPAFNFGSGNPFGNANVGTWAPGSGVKIVSESQDQPAEESEEPQEQLNLDGPGPGEEDEDMVYEKKTKLYELQDKDYKPIGVGNLRVLVHKETHKTRILVRSDIGRVLLNVAIRKEFTYTVIGKGQVKVVDIKAGESTPTIYVLRVKTEEDGEQLASILQEKKA